jgi:carboxymethylenebutenolidase
MCHPEVPAGTPIPDVSAIEEAVPLGGGERMPGLLALPNHLPAPAVLIINDIYGRSPFYESLARRLAQAGLVGFTPEFFFRLPPIPERTLEHARARRGKLDDVRALDDLSRAIDWLAARDEVGGRPVGIIGFCMGGTFVLNLAALKPKVAAAVCYYGFPAAGGAPGGAPKPLDQVGDMKAPLLGFWGEEDAGVGMDNVESLRRKLAAAGKDHEFHVYPGLGHGFLAAFLEDPSTPGYDVACESWARTLDFYRERLVAPA